MYIILGMSWSLCENHLLYGIRCTACHVIIIDTCKCEESHPFSFSFNSYVKNCKNEVQTIFLVHTSFILSVPSLHDVRDLTGFHVIDQSSVCSIFLNIQSGSLGSFKHNKCRNILKNWRKDKISSFSFSGLYACWNKCCYKLWFTSHLPIVNNKLKFQ